MHASIHKNQAQIDAENSSGRDTERGYLPFVIAIAHARRPFTVTFSTAIQTWTLLVSPVSMLVAFP